MATGCVVVLDLGEALLHAAKVTVAPFDLDVHAIDAARDFVERGLGFEPPGDRVGEPLPGVGQCRLGVRVFGGLGGQQLARLQAHEPLAQRREPGLGGLELRIQAFAFGVQAGDVRLQRVDARLAGELAEMKILRSPQMAGAAVFAVIAIAGDPLDVAWLLACGLRAVDAADAVEQRRQPARHRCREAHDFGEACGLGRWRLLAFGNDEVAKALALAQRPGRVAIAVACQQDDVPIRAEHR